MRPAPNAPHPREGSRASKSCNDPLRGEEARSSTRECFYKETEAESLLVAMLTKPLYAMGLALLSMLATSAAAAEQENSPSDSAANSKAPIQAVQDDENHPSNIGEFYVVQDTNSARCTILAKKPTDMGLIVIGARGHKSRNEALIAMRSVRSCGAD